MNGDNNASGQETAAESVLRFGELFNGDNDSGESRRDSGKFVYKGIWRETLTLNAPVCIFILSKGNGLNGSFCLAETEAEERLEEVIHRTMQGLVKWEDVTFDRSRCVRC